jgi:hypothetical protein
METGPRAHWNEEADRHRKSVNPPVLFFLSQGVATLAENKLRFFSEQLIIVFSVFLFSLKLPDEWSIIPKTVISFFSIFVCHFVHHPCVVSVSSIDIVVLLQAL